MWIGKINLFTKFIYDRTIAQFLINSSLYISQKCINLHYIKLYRQFTKCYNYPIQTKKQTLFLEWNGLAWKQTVTNVHVIKRMILTLHRGLHNRCAFVCPHSALLSPNQLVNGMQNIDYHQQSQNLKNLFRNDASCRGEHFTLSLFAALRPSPV